MGAFIRLFLRTMVIIVLLVVVVGGGWLGWLAWRFDASIPRIEGETTLVGLSGEVQIFRDDRGVPHIFGESDADVFFGLGYVHAQDRLFQMDLLRRSVEGRLSEVLGASALPIDRRSRILGFARSAEAASADLSPETRAVVEAYAAGINALIASRGFVAPPEYHLLMFSPEPWTVEATAGVLYYMADDLVTGAADEVSRRVLASVLDEDEIDEFLTPYPDFGVTALSAADLGLTRGGTSAPAGVEEEPAPGSNNWVVSGDLTASGAPLLANDPHLNLSAPGVWYLARLALQDGDVVGMTLPGSPFIVLGHNEHAAWAFTNTGFDVQDLIEIPRAELNARVREERIRVRFGATVTVEVEETDLGPVLERDLFGLAAFPAENAVILRTTADDPDNGGAEASLGFMHANSWDEFVRAGVGWTAPMQNMLFASDDGTIGYAAPGRLPARDAEGRWVGEVPFARLPRVRNPASGRIATANNRITPDEYPYPTPGSYAVYRAMRIEDRLSETNLHDRASFQHIQLDTVSVHAQRLMPALSRARPSTELGRIALSLFANWNGEMDASRAEPLIFATWYRMLHPAIYADELEDLYDRYDYPRRVFIDHVLNGRLSHWCDDVSTPGERETCSEITGRALDAAAVLLLENWGPDPNAWRWGDAHQAVFDHPVPFLNTLPLFGQMFGDRQPVGGDGSTVNVAHFRFGEPFDVFHAASMRAIYDLSDLDGSQFALAPGQSGHPLSPHYRDLAPLWAAGEYFEVRTDWSPDAPPPTMRLLRLLPAE